MAELVRGWVAQVRQSLGPPYSVVVLQSTAEFADLMGPPLTDELDPAEQEYVAGELYPAFERLLKEGFGVAAALPAPSWGPAVHRWEAATTNIEQHERPPSQQAFPEARVAFAGDWLSPEEGDKDAGAYRVYRGGSWDSSSSFSRVSYRYWLTPTNRTINLGFRLARSSQWAYPRPLPRG